MHDVHVMQTLQTSANMLSYYSNFLIWKLLWQKLWD